MDLVRTVDQRIIVNVDATFTIVPELVFQLYTIHGYTNAGFIRVLPARVCSVEFTTCGGSVKE